MPDLDEGAHLDELARELLAWISSNVSTRDSSLRGRASTGITVHPHRTVIRRHYGALRRPEIAIPPSHQPAEAGVTPAASEMA